jgi:hypothetical protein
VAGFVHQHQQRRHQHRDRSRTEYDAHRATGASLEQVELRRSSCASRSRRVLRSTTCRPSGVNSAG